MMSTMVSSIEENGIGGNYAYRCSKTALNMAMKNFSLEAKDRGILVLSMHPGYVKTDMNEGQGLIEASTCAARMIDTLLNLTEKDNGSFQRFDHANTIPW